MGWRRVRVEFGKTGWGEEEGRSMVSKRCELEERGGGVGGGAW